MMTDDGLAHMLNSMLDRAGLKLRLFSNDADVQAKLTRDDVTECSGFGYKPIGLGPLGWKRLGARAEHPEQTFVFTGKLGKIYGAFVTNNDDVIISAEKFDEPFYALHAGDKLHVGVELDMRAANRKDA